MITLSSSAIIYHYLIDLYSIEKQHKLNTWVAIADVEPFPYGALLLEGFQIIVDKRHIASESSKRRDVKRGLIQMH